MDVYVLTLPGDLEILTILVERGGQADALNIFKQVVSLDASVTLGRGL